MVSPKFSLTVRKLLLLKSPLGLPPFIDNKITPVFRCVAPIPLIILNNILIQCRCYAPYEIFPVVYSINCGSPNGLFNSNNFRILRKTLNWFTI
jgi:hypothetical protein